MNLSRPNTHHEVGKCTTHTLWFPFSPAQQTLLINHFWACVWPLNSSQHSTPGNHYNQWELAPEMKSACHPSTRVKWGRDLGWTWITQRRSSRNSANGEDVTTQQLCTAVYVNGNNLLIWAATSLFLTCFRHYRDPAKPAAISWTLVLWRQFYPWWRIKGHNQGYVLGVLLEKWFASKESLAQWEGQVSRLARYSPPVPPILQLPPGFYSNYIPNHS